LREAALRANPKARSKRAFACLLLACLRPQSMSANAQLLAGKRTSDVPDASTLIYEYTARRMIRF
jgi:hypothetical protein